MEPHKIVYPRLLKPCFAFNYPLLIFRFYCSMLTHYRIANHKSTARLRHFRLRNFTKVLKVKDHTNTCFLTGVGNFALIRVYNKINVIDHGNTRPEGMLIVAPINNSHDIYYSLSQRVNKYGCSRM